MAIDPVPSQGWIAADNVCGSRTHAAGIGDTVVEVVADAVVDAATTGVDAWFEVTGIG
jgi:hypothetical protein